MSRDDRYREKNKSIKYLKAEIRQLRKHLKLAYSEIALLRALWEKDVLDMARKQRREKIVEKKQPVCPECGNPTLDVTELGIWKLSRCNSCDFFHREKMSD